MRCRNELARCSRNSTWPSPNFATHFPARRRIRSGRRVRSVGASKPPRARKPEEFAGRTSVASSFAKPTPDFAPGYLFYVPKIEDTWIRRRFPDEQGMWSGRLAVRHGFEP